MAAAKERRTPVGRPPVRVPESDRRFSLVHTGEKRGPVPALSLESRYIYSDLHVFCSLTVYEERGTSAHCRGALWLLKRGRGKWTVLFGEAGKPLAKNSPSSRPPNRIGESGRS